MQCILHPPPLAERLIAELRIDEAPPPGPLMCA